MEACLYEPGSVPEYTTAEWYSHRDRAPHLEEGLHRGRLLLAAKMVAIAVKRYKVASVSDMGCGDGGLLSLLNVPAWGYDLQPSNVEAGCRDRQVNVQLGDATSDHVEWGDLAVCTEMLEHLLDPHGFVERIPSRAVVASSPTTETADAHYPFHTWAWDHEGYAAVFTRAGFEIVRHEDVAMFQVVLAVRR